MLHIAECTFFFFLLLLLEKLVHALWTWSPGRQDGFESTQSPFHLVKAPFEPRGGLLHGPNTFLHSAFNLTEKLRVHFGLNPIDPLTDPAVDLIHRLEEHQLGIPHLTHQVGQQSIV